MAEKILASISSNATSAASGASFAIDAEVDGTNKQLFTVDANADGARFAQLRPRASVQRVAVKITVDGVDVSSNLLAGSWSVKRSLKKAIQLGGFTFAPIDGVSVLGSILGLAAPATGLKSINVSLVYQQDNGETFEVPLITNGIADQTQVRSDRGTSEQLSLADAGRLYRDIRATKIIPAGSGLTRARVVALIAAAAGVSLISIPEIPGRVYKAIELLEGNWISLAQAIADIGGYRLLWDPDGTYTAVEDAAFERPQKAARWLYTEADLVRSINGSSVPFVLRPAPEAWTKVELRGSKQVLRDTCGLKTRSLKATGFVDEVSPAYSFEQSSSTGLVSDAGITILTGSRVGSKTITEVTFRCRDVINERVRTWALFNPTQWRYFRNTDGTIKVPGSGGFSDSWLLEDDSASIAHVYARPHFLKVLDVITEKTFISDTLRRIEKRTRSYYNPRRHVKSRASISISWESSSADTDWRDNGNGDGVTTTRDSLIVTERQVEDYSSTSDGFVREKRTRLYRWAKKEGGGLFLYGDGAESSDTAELFRLVSETIESYVPITEDLFAKQVISYGLDRKWLESVNETAFGSPPVIDVLESLSPVASNFDSTEEFQAAKAASKFEQQAIEAECDASDLEAVRPQRVLPQAAVEWAETEDELQALCDRLVLLGLSPILEFTVPINGSLREGDLVWVRNRQPGPAAIDNLTKVLDVDHGGSVAGPKVTKVMALIVPEDDALG